MPDGFVAMSIAWRALMAITNGAKPELQDVEELLSIAPEYSDLPIDEIACEVVPRA